MARQKKGEAKKVSIVWILILIMIFGTLAGAFLFSQPQSPETPPPKPVPTEQPREETITLRHNPSNATIFTSAGFQTITYDDLFVYVDHNHPLANRTLTFELELVNITRPGFAAVSAAQEGDWVDVEYVGRLEDGNVFDTTRKEVAEDPGERKVDWFSPRAAYKPLRYRLGDRAMIRGFEEAIVGMPRGERKTAVIPPEKGYGQYNASSVERIPLVQEIPKRITVARYISVPREVLEQGLPGANLTEGAVLPFPGEEFNISIYKAADKDLTVERLMTVGSVYKLSVLPWKDKVISVSGNSIILEHVVRPGMAVRFREVPWNTTVVQ